MMIKRAVIILYLVAPLALGAQVNTPATVGGCYVLHPSKADSATALFGMHRAFQLDSVTAPGAPAHFRVAPQPLDTRGHPSAGWAPVGVDSVTVWWNSRWTRLTLHLAVHGDTLRGVADFRNDEDGYRSHTQLVHAFRRSCAGMLLTPAV